MLLHVQSRFDTPRAIVAAAGEMDMSTADLVRTEVMLAMTNGCTAVTLDLNEVSFIDSVSLGMLVGCHKRLRDLGGGALQIVINNHTVLRMLAITRLDEVFSVVDTRAPEAPVA